MGWRRGWRGTLRTGIVAALTAFGSVTALAPASVAGAAMPQAPAPAAGAVVALAGTPHLWVSGEDGLYHWVGDSRSLAQRPADWGTRREVAAAELQALPRGEPWLSAPLLRFGQAGSPDGPGAIYLPKWEAGEARPTLLHIRSLADLQVFGIDGDNWGRLVREAAEWEAATGFGPGTLPRGVLPPAVPGLPGPPGLPAPVPAPPAAPVASPPVWAPAPDGELAVTNRGFVTRTRDGVAWTWVPAWYEQVGRDDRLMDALVLVSTVEPEYRTAVAANLVPSGARIVWGTLPGGALGSYRHTTKTVTVSSRFADDRGGAAAVLAHEVFHAQFPHEQRGVGTPGRSDACVEEEAAAFEWATRVWVSLPNDLKVASSLQDTMGPLVRTWLAGSLQETIRRSPGYRAQCRLTPPGG